MLIYRQSNSLSRTTKVLSSIIHCRLSRIDREGHEYESRLKQYENEITELKTRCDAMKFDATRKSEENEV